MLSQWLRLFPTGFTLSCSGWGSRKRLTSSVLSLAVAHHAPVVATNDVRFIDSSDFEAHEVRVCISGRRTLDDPRRPRNYTDQQYLKSSQEMAELFADIPEACVNATEIGKRCSLSLSLGTPICPTTWYPMIDRWKPILRTSAAGSGSAAETIIRRDRCSEQKAVSILTD